jgi:hypothetical protein
MRITAGLVVLALGACGVERQPDGQAAASAAGSSAVEVPAAAKAARAQSSPLMAMPDDPAALKRLEAMGYTVHEDHLHAPGVTSCPKMGDDPVM